jgi:hypothetical protein
VIYLLSMLGAAGCFICAIISLPARTHHDVFPVWTLPLWAVGFAVCFLVAGWAENRD